MRLPDHNGEWRALSAHETAEVGDLHCNITISLLEPDPKDRIGRYEPVIPASQAFLDAWKGKSSLPFAGAKVGIMASGWGVLRRTQ